MNLKNLILGIGIVIVFGLLLWQGVETFSPSPQYEDFCPYERIVEPIDTQAKCEAVGGRWNPPIEPRQLEEKLAGYCDYDFTCREEYEEERKSHSQVVFIISLIVGLIVLVIGYFVLSVEPVGSALIGSGIWALFWGSAVNWRNFASGIRFVLLLIAFVFIVWLTLRLNGERKESFRK